MPTIWNASDRLNITLSGANLVATVATNSTASGVRTTDSLGSSKFYWEYTGTAFFGGYGVLIGVANANAVLSSVATNPVNAAVVNGQGGTIYVNGTTSSGSLGTQSTGNVIGIALDLTNNNIWFRVTPSGNWNGSGTANPATNAGGFSVSPITSIPLYGLVSAVVGLQNAAITANFGGGAFNGAVPAGFTSGFPLGGSGGGGAASQARAIVMA